MTLKVKGAWQSHEAKGSRLKARGNQASEQGS